MIRAVVLIGGSEYYHDCIAGGQALVDMLSAQGIAAVLSQDASLFGDRRSERFDVALLYSQQKRLTTAEQEALDRFVAHGHGFVPVHAANVLGMPDHERYEGMVGSAFTSHDRFGRFTVSVAGSHPVTEGVQDFAIDDELYHIEWRGTPGDVLATGSSEATPAAPVIYTRTHGAGRICYIALGHDGRAWGHPSFRTLVGNATRWAAGRVTADEAASL
jgi:type 1 glutamine amidotransferase